MITPPNREGIVSHNGERLSTGWLILIARLFLGGVFIYASLDKIFHPFGPDHTAAHGLVLVQGPDLPVGRGIPDVSSGRGSTS